MQGRTQGLTHGTTPNRGDVDIPRIKLFDIQREENGNDDYHLEEVIPINTDLEVLLINSCKIDVTKVQMIVSDFMTGKSHSTIFCMTETKVEGHDFQPLGIKIFSKHRVSRKEKKGGGLALGYATSANIKFEELDTTSNDILALEGKINNIKCRVVLCYFDCTKKHQGKDFNKNRVIQKQVEDLMEVDLDTALHLMLF